MRTQTLNDYEYLSVVDENRTSITLGPNIECKRRQWKPTDPDEANMPTTTPASIEDADDRTKLEFITHAIIGMLCMYVFCI